MCTVFCSKFIKHNAIEASLHSHKNYVITDIAIKSVSVKVQVHAFDHGGD